MAANERSSDSDTDKNDVIYKYLPPSFQHGIPDDYVYVEKLTFKQKMLTKCAENPLVPIGLLATTAALFNGLYMMYKGDRAGSQRMMRYRVSGQGFTIAVLSVGILTSMGMTAMKKDKELKTAKPSSNIETETR